MKRYSNLYGTIYAGNSNVAVYASVGSSQQLPAFLNEVGATNAQLTVDTVRNILAGFPNSEEFKNNYASQPQNDLPVSVRYAPMHLRNHPDMPSTIKPFTAIGVSGNENKKNEGDTRYSTYVQTIYIGREHMHEAVEEKVNGTVRSYNYLDQIFGTKLLSHTELAMVRGGRVSMDYDALPEKVTPKMQLRDRTVVFNTVDAVFDNKPVVIRLEKGCGFNSRAMELLTAVYALMPPRLATEIGFATYLNPSEIQKLVADTSMRIFVLPAECTLNGLDSVGALVMDLSSGEQVRGTASEEMGKLLNRWNKMPWEKRQMAMEKVFADTAATFNDKSLFMQRSAEFLDSADAWEKGGWVQRGAFTTLEELKAKYDSIPLCTQIPWMKDAFIARVPVMMKDKGAIHKLTGQALAQWKFGKDESAKDLYEFGLSMGGTNTRAMADAAGALVRVQVQEEAAVELNAANARTAQEKAKGEAAVAAAVAAGESAVAAEREKTAKAVADGEAAVAAAVAAGQSAVAAEQEKTAKAVADGEAAVAAEQEKTAKAVADGEAAVAAEQEKAEQLKKVAAEKIKAERDAHQATQEKLDAQVQQHQATQQQLTAVSGQLETTRQQLEAAEERLKKAAAAYTELRQAKAVSDGKVAAAEQAQAAAEQAKAELDRLKDETDAQKKKYEGMIKKTNQRLVIFAAAGFLVAALIFGVIMLIVGLTGGEEPEVTTEPTASVQTATEPSTEATVEATEAPTELPTEAPTEPEEPNLSDWTDDATAQWLMAAVPGLQDVILEPTGIPGELEKIAGYAAVAMILTGEDAEPDTENYAVLLQHVGQESDMVGTEKLSVESETSPAGDEEADPADPSEEAPALEAVEVEDARMVLTSEEYVLAIYGDDTSVVNALACFSNLVDADQTVLTRLTIDHASWDVDAILSTMLPVSQWWRSVTAINADAQLLSEEMAALELDEEAVLCITCNGENYYFVVKMLTSGAEALADQLLDAGHMAAWADNLVVFAPMVQG